MLLIRHGQSEFNAAFTHTRVDPGIPDPDLTDIGRRQAAEAADALRQENVRRLIASPYRRTLQTASIIAERLGVPIEIDARVRERAAFHCDIGTRVDRLSPLFPELRFDHLPDPWWHDHLALGRAETEDELSLRAQDFRRDAARLHDWREVGVVTHWGFVRSLTGRQVQNGEILRIDLSAAPAESGRQ
ncbi:MAG: histidine phosphatase family protein [Alphaproteobacteria bacterium]|nr:histidine phosphatase family protein [Alphaproteobacteria bacterium]